jgi:hypothetical protein
MLRWSCLRPRPRPGATARKRSDFAFAHWRQTCWRPDLFLSVEAAEIAGGREISHGCSSGTRLIGSLANAAAADERCDPLIKRRRPLRAVSHPPCLRACCAVERAIVEPQIVKLYFCPSDVIFRDSWRHLAMVRNPGADCDTACRRSSASAENPEWRSPALCPALFKMRVSSSRLTSVFPDGLWTRVICISRPKSLQIGLLSGETHALDEGALRSAHNHSPVRT